MHNGTWFQNSTWGPEIEEQFRAHLKRARDKARYLHIQASTLAVTHPQVALALLEEYFATDDAFYRTQAYVEQSRAHLAEGNVNAALSALESALTREQEFPHVRTQACLLLPYLIAEQELSQHYQRALDVLDAHRSSPVFPIERYQWHGARALIMFEQGKREEAVQEARLALEAARQTKSGFKHHPEVGLVENTSDHFGNRLKRIAKSKSWWFF